MAVHDAVRAALDGKEHEKHKTHVHEVHYKRAPNGGFTATLHHHHGEPNKGGGLSHVTEPHILPDMEASQGHMDHYMGDQPEFGEMQEPPAAGTGAGGAMEAEPESPEQA